MIHTMTSIDCLKLSYLSSATQKTKYYHKINRKNDPKSITVHFLTHLKKTILNSKTFFHVF